MVISVFRSRLRPENEPGFQELAARMAWRELPAHRGAQELGREHYYAEYSLQVFEQPLRESRFPCSP